MFNITSCILLDGAPRGSIPAAIRDSIVQSKIEAMKPENASILVNAVGLGSQPGSYFKSV